MKGRLIAAALGGLICLAAASDPAERLSDPAKEARARALFREIRCVQCQSESIDDSEAPLAQEFRQIVREQVAAGRSDAEIKAYFHERYGAFVLLRPPFDWANAAVWGLPVLALAGGGAALVAYVRRRARVEAAPLTPEEEAEIRAKVKALDERQAFAASTPHENT